MGWMIIPVVIAMLYMAFSPVYIFPSGLPQPADMFVMLGIIWYITSVMSNAKVGIPVYYVAGLFFVTLTILVNGINYFIFRDFKFVMAIMYMLYNFLILGFFIGLSRLSGERGKMFLYAGIIGAVLIELYYVQFGHKPTYRAIGSFTNPNQLAYWALLTTCMLVMLRHNQRFNLLDYGLLFLLAYIQTQALSKAGLITFSILMVIIFFSPQVAQREKIILFMLSVLAVIVLMFQPQQIERIERLTALSGSIERLNNIGEEGDDSAEGRGYDRIMNNPEYILLGAGEGAFWRFSRKPNMELHSGLGTILFSYGVLGFGLFFWFVYCLLRKAPWHYYAMVGVVLLFGVAHQNIRFTHFWVFLALIYATKSPVTRIMQADQLYPDENAQSLLHTKEL